jgi:hypothetical protein
MCVTTGVTAGVTTSDFGDHGPNMHPPHPKASARSTAFGARIARDRSKTVRRLLAVGRKTIIRKDGQNALLCWPSIFIYIHYRHETTSSRSTPPANRPNPAHGAGQTLCHAPGPRGPYYNLQWRQEGKAVSRYVPGNQVELVAQHTANHQTFQNLVGQYAQLIVERTRAERATGF